MARESQQETPSNPEVRHETRDINVRPIIWFGVGLLVVALVLHLLLAGLLFNWAEDRARSEPARSPLAKQRIQFPDELGKIPGPRLQAREFDDLNELREYTELARGYLLPEDGAGGRARVPTAPFVRGDGVG